MKEEEPIRIAQIIGKMWAGGVETVVFNYYRALDHNKVQFDFYYDADSTVEPPEDIIEMGARFYKLSPYQKLWKYIFELRSYLINKKYTIIHSHLNTLSIFPLFVAWTIGIPVRVAHNHSVSGGNEWKRNIVKNILKYFAKIFATDYFACSEKAGRWLFGNKAFNKGKVLIINNAVDFEKFKISKNEVDELRNKLSLEDKFVVGHVGRFTFAKNHMKLLSIFNEIKKQRNNARLLLVGDGELYGKIINKIRELNLESDVICVGKVAEPQKYYHIMDILILPSIFEGFSLTTLEAQISGVPAVISEVVPKEAIISNGCIYKNVNDSITSWVTAAEQLAKQTVVLNEKVNKYDINKCAIKLQNWYLAHSK